MKLIPTLTICATSLGCTAPDSADAPAPSVATAPLPEHLAQSVRGQSFDAFDQDMQGGWRSLAKTKDFATAAMLIDAYLDANESLLGWQRALLNFHAGQMFADAGDVDVAVRRFRDSMVSEDVGPGWEPYVRATIAFLQRDRAALDRAYADLIAAPQPGGPDPNIHVVESLRAHFDWSYARAYEATRSP